MKKIPIDFKKISEETGVKKGKIHKNQMLGWVISGHPDIDLICIDPPEGTVKIKDNHWIIG